MKILAISCIHGDIENLMHFIDKISLMDFDAIVCPGDFTDATLPKGFTRVDVTKLIIEELRGLSKPIFAVPGSWDKEIIGLLKDEDISIHGMGKVLGGIGFYGFGGAKTPFNLPFEPNEEEILLGLTLAHDQIKNCNIKIQVTHAPPMGTKLDVIFAGAHVGSEAVRSFIETHRPKVAISSHIHEARGIDELGDTKIVNPGRFPEGYCGLVEIENGNVSAKIINLI
jgi:hypothetical protein